MPVTASPRHSPRFPKLPTPALPAFGPLSSFREYASFGRSAFNKTGATKHAPVTGAMFIFRSGILIVFNTAFYLVYSIFSTPTFARGLVTFVSFGLCTASITCYRSHDIRALRLLIAPTLLFVGIELAVLLQYLSEHTHLYVTAFIGFVVAWGMVVLAVCGPSPRSNQMQFVSTTIGLVAPLVLCIASIFSNYSALYPIGIFSSVLASSANLLFNKS